MNLRFLLRTCITTAALGSVSLSFASGFQIWEQDNAGIGDYHAGAAVDTNNTGIEFYNPAGMVFMNDPRPQASGGLTYIPLDVKFDGVVSYNDNPTSTNGWVDGGTNNFIPNFHFIAPIGDRWAVGFGVTTPFGLATSYPSTLPTDHAATKTKLLTVNLNPNAAYKVTNWLAIGGGADLEYGSAEFDNTEPGIPGDPADKSHFSDWAWGWNAGLYLKPTLSTDIGIAYRSAITHNAKGKNSATVLMPPSNEQTSNITATLPLPATLTISAEQSIGNKFKVLASAERTFWNSFSKLTMHNMIDPWANVNNSPITIDVTVPFNYSNTWNLAAGAHYKINRIITVEAGGGFDFTPTNDKDRDIRLPGTNRWAIALGAHLNLSKHFTMDGGWTYLIPTEKAKINNQGPQGIPFTTITTTGLAKTNANVFGLQLTALL